MKKVLSLFAAAVILAACGKDNPTPEPTPGPSPTTTPGTTQLPLWNKANTFYLSYIGNFDNTSLGTDSASYQPVISLANSAKEVSHVIMLDRCDVDNRSGFNGLVFTAGKTTLFNSFAVNKYNGTTVEGTGILVKHSLRSQKSYAISPGCNLKLVETRRTPDKVQAEVVVQPGIPFYLGYINLDSPDQVTAAKRMLKYALDNSYSITGTATPAIFEALSDGLKDIGVSYRLEKFTLANKGRVLFFLSPRNIVLRETTANTSGSVVSALMSIECGVVY